MNIKTALLTTALMLGVGMAQAQVASPEVAAAAGIPTSTPSTMQMHNDQMMAKLQQELNQMQSDVRELQRQNMALQKKVDEANLKSGGVNDQVQQLQNVNLVNISAAQKQLSLQNADILKKLWGEGKRDCPELDAKHQQIKILTRPDGGRSVRFLCYDGKALHLGTEVHDPAE